MASNPFTIDYAQEALADLQSLRGFERKNVVDGIENHLQHEPMKESRSRIKRMKQPFWCEYRLRVDDFRVYYDVSEAERRVIVLRVLEKGRDSTPGKDKP
jgi:mRNA interferase RelE/StbE